MTALLHRAIVYVGPCLSWLWTLLSSSFSPARFLWRNQLIALWALLCRLTVSFPLAAFRILSLFLILGNLMMMCLGVFLFGSYFFGTLWASWTSWKSSSFTRLGKFSFIICSNKFSISCSYSSPSGTHIIWILECFRLSQRFVTLSSLFWILVSPFCSSWMFIFFLLLQIIVLSPGFLPVTLGSLNILLYSFWVSFICFFIFWSSSIRSVSILITRALNSPSDGLAISSSLNSLSGFALFFHLGPISLSWSTW